VLEISIYLRSLFPVTRDYLSGRHVTSVEKAARENRKGMGGNTKNDFLTWCRLRPAANKNI